MYNDEDKKLNSCTDCIDEEERKDRLRDIEEKLAPDFWKRYIEIIRREHKGGLTEVCKETGLPYKTLANQISSNRLPKTSLMMEIANSAKTTVPFLLYGDESRAMGNEEFQLLQQFRANSSFKLLVSMISSLNPEQIRSLAVTAGLLFPEFFSSRSH